MEIKGSKKMKKIKKLMEMLMTKERKYHTSTFPTKSILLTVENDFFSGEDISKKPLSDKMLSGSTQNPDPMTSLLFSVSVYYIN